MYARNIFESLKNHLSNKQVTVITGMRRVGKSTALKYLLGEILHQNKIYFDLEKIENRYLFNQVSYKEIEIGLAIEGIDFSQPAVIALDEIQLVPSITSVIKYLYDTYDIKFIVTGSSSFYIKNRFSESLAGRKRIFEMYPLDFKEFIDFKEQNSALLIPYKMVNFHATFYQKWKELYNEFITFGGFPEVVLTENEHDKKEYIKDIINAYIELDIKLLSDFSASDDLYKLIRLLAIRTGSRIDYSKISSILGINRHKIKDYLQLLEYTYFIKTIPAYSASKDREISKQEKLYFADNGILNHLGQVSSGQAFENSIAIQLARLGKVAFYQKKTGQEIDFILDETHAFEVKETPTNADLGVLQSRSQAIYINNYNLIGKTAPNNDFKTFIWGGNIF